MFTMADEEKARKFSEDDLLEEGKEKGIIVSIKTMMKNLKLSAEQAMETLEIPSSKWSHCINML